MTEQQLHLDEIRHAIRQLCGQFPEEYWRDLDERHAYPEEFIQTLIRDGWLSILIPEEFGGSGLGILEASVVLEEINRSGANAAPGHAQMYTMGAILRHGSPEQKKRWLPGIANGDVRLQAFGITEPTAGSDTTSISTFAERRGDYYHVRGQKIFISRVQHSDLMLLIARTSLRDQVVKKTDGLSLMVMDLREQGERVRVKPIRTMVNHETNEVFFADAVVPVENLIGEEGKGFRYLLSGVNAERILVGSECLGDGQYFVDKAVEYTGSRHVFGRPIGQNQGVQFPIAQAYMDLEAAILMRNRAAELFSEGVECGPEANMTKYLASEASWKAANAAMMAFGGYGLAVEYNIERKFREARLPLVAPISNNLVQSYVAQHVLGMPRSY